MAGANFSLKGRGASRRLVEGHVPLGMTIPAFGPCPSTMLRMVHRAGPIPNSAHPELVEGSQNWAVLARGPSTGSGRADAGLGSGK